MATKTFSITEDAYERLGAEKREGKSFSDVVCRLTAGVDLTAFHGALSEETADELEAGVEARREAHAASRDDRLDRITRSFDGE